MSGGEESATMAEHPDPAQPNVTTDASITARAQRTCFVTFRPDTPPPRRRQLIADLWQGRMTRWLSQIHTAVVETPEPIVLPAAAEIRQVDAIVRVERDGPVAGVRPIAAGAAPDLAPFAAQMAQATSQYNDPDLAQDYAPFRIRAVDAWPIVTGSDVAVAVLDTGIEQTHPEFAERILPGYNFVADNAVVQDDNGHGTHVSGIIGAALNNGQGSAGVAPDSLLLPVKVLNQSNIGAWSYVVAGILFALERGAQVIDMSLGAPASAPIPETVMEAIQVAQVGALLVAAAGNTASSEPFLPAALDEVMGVGATDENDDAWPFSNFGEWVDVAAPGVCVFSTYEENGYAMQSGTSMAAAHVSGLGALLLAQDGTRTPPQVRAIIRRTAHPLSEPDGEPRFGAGRIDALRAVDGTQSIFLPFAPR